MSPPLSATRRVHFTTHEGSFLSFDVSPDGTWIAFDLLGEIWRLPVAGGVARPITSVVRDTADFADPVIASDGRSVLARGEWRGREGFFTFAVSDGRTTWTGADSLDWFRNPLTLSPSRSRDTRRLLFARRGIGGSWTCVERTIETGVERELAITAPSGASCHGPQYSIDEREVYFEAITNQPNTFPSGGRIWRVAAEGGVPQPVTPPDVRARAVSVAPDDRHIAYLVMDSLNRAHVWTQAVSDSAGVKISDEDDVVPTRVRWLGSDTVIYVAGGRLWRRDVHSRVRREIPFSATVDFVRIEPTLPPVRFATPGENVALRGAVRVALSPDGGAIATLAANRLWISPARAGAVARPIATLPLGADGLQWSPDGSQIVWFGGEFGEEDIFATDTASGATSRLTALRGTERSPQWSPDGRYLTFLHIARDSGKEVLRQLVVAAPVRTVRSASETRELGPGGGFQWSPRSDALLQLGPDTNARTRSATLHFLDGAPPRPVRGLPGGVSSVRWLPGDTLAFVAAGRLMHAPFDAAAGLVSAATPISDEPALFLYSARKGDLLYASEDGLRLRRGGASPLRVGWPVHLTVPSAPPPLLIRNVRIIDGTGAGPTTPRDILIREGRVSRIGESGRVTVESGTQVLEAGGRTAIPGLIDLHSHAASTAQLRGQLFFGVTTDRHLDYPTSSYDEVNAGALLGPRQAGSHFRIYTNWPFDLGSIVTEADDRHLDRLLRSAIFGLGSTLLKVYSNSRWAPQVRAVAGAHALGARATGHCAYPLALVASGIESKEHVGRQCTLRDAGIWYDDLIQLYASARVPVVPTLSLFLGLDRFRSAPLRMPPEVAGLFRTPERRRLEEDFTGEPTAPAFRADYAHALRATRDLHRAGAIVGTGTDYERPDALQYELEAFVEASFTPLEAIAAATTVAARIMGASDEIGRIAPGFLADIVILDGDPTQDIRQVRRIWSVIQGGREVDRRALVASGWDSVTLPP